MKVIERIGTSSTGSKHGLRVQMDENGVVFTVTGVNGKRHASVRLPLGDAADVTAEVREFLHGQQEGK